MRVGRIRIDPNRRGRGPYVLIGQQHDDGQRYNPDEIGLHVARKLFYGLAREKTSLLSPTVPWQKPTSLRWMAWPRERTPIL